MATIEQLLNRVLRRLELAEGLDVQTHQEGKLIETMREVYETLFDDHWWRDQIFVDTLTLDGTTGTVTTDLSDRIKRYYDIHSVYPANSSKALPIMDIGQNVSRIHRNAITPVADPEKVFKVVPADTTGTIDVWYRTRLDEDVWEDGQYQTNIPFDDHLMIFGTCADFLIDEGINTDAAEKFASKYQARLDKLRVNEWQSGISKSPQNTGYGLTDWTEEQH